MKLKTGRNDIFDCCNGTALHCAPNFFNTFVQLLFTFAKEFGEGPLVSLQLLKGRVEGSSVLPLLLGLLLLFAHFPLTVLPAGPVTT